MCLFYKYKLCKKKINDTKNTFSNIVHNIPSISLYNFNSGRICTILFFSRIICQADGIQVVQQTGDEDHDPENDLDLEARAENVEDHRLETKSRPGGKIFFTLHSIFSFWSVHRMIHWIRNI